MSRVVSWFSCGAASAYATWLAVMKYKDVDVVYCKVREEHEDSDRFMNDFINITGIPIKTIINTQFDGSIFNVFRHRKFIKNQYGAPCTMLLKKEMRRQYQRLTDKQVFGYTFEEQNRADNFLDANNEVNEDFILIKSQITKDDCFDFIRSIGIELPEMYKLGYPNNNCIGCVKGGMGYWNAIRKDFPGRFNKMALLEREIGHAVNKDKKGPVYLDELAPNQGNKMKDMPGVCGFTCEVSHE